MKGMSYDFSLRDRVSGETVQLPFKHVMKGGMYQVDPETMQPVPIAEARLNITFNYSDYYYEATKGNKDFEIDGDNGGIKSLHGKTGLESIKMLDNMIKNIEKKHPNLETSNNYWDSCPGNAVKPLYQLKTMAELRPDAVWDVSY